MREEIQEWQYQLKAALTLDETHHIPVPSRRAKSGEEQQPRESTKDKLKKKPPEKKRCGWPGLRYAPVPKPKKEKGPTKVKK